MSDVLIPLLAIGVGGIIVLVPIVGLTLRFAFQPLMERWAELRGAPVEENRVESMEHRLRLLEQNVDRLEADNRRLMDDAEFRLQLNTSDRV